MKRILSMLLVLVMVVGLLPVHVHAEECTHPGLSFGKSYSGTHSATCYSCWSYVSASCTYGSSYEKTSSGHYSKCTVCGGYNSSARQDHDWGYASGYAGTGKHKRYCKVCGYEESYTSSCSYTYGAYESVNGQHWQVCTACGQAGAKTNCSSWNGTVSNGDGTHSLTCSTCKTAATTSCTYGSLTYDSYNVAQGHYRSCTACGQKTKAEAHTNLKYTQTSSGYHKVTCADCGATVKSSEQCSNGSTYQHNDTQHWKECTLCGGKSSVGNHNGSVTSNADKTHTIGCSTCSANTTTACTFGSWKNDSWNGNHYRECTQSGCSNKETGAHELEYIGTDGSEYHSASCKQCSYTVSSQRCTLGSYVQGDTQHWKVCSVCNTKGTISDHSGTIGKIDGDATHHSVTCSDCKKVATVECTFGTWTNDSLNGNHKATCTVYGCNNTKTEAHKDLQYSSNGYGTHKTTCGICGTTVTYSENCDFGDYTNNGQNHSRTCSACNYVETKEHQFDSTTKQCVCGAVRHDHEWKLVGSGNTMTLSCVATIGTCGKAGGMMTIGAVDAVYDGTEKPADVCYDTATYLGERAQYASISYEKYNETTGTYQSHYGVPKNAGKYRAKISVSMEGQSATISVDYEITKAKLAVTAQGYEGTYDGQEHGIEVTIPQGYDLAVTYSTDGQSFYYTSSPKYKDAGEYTVYYKVTDNSGNYELTNGTGSAVVEIEKADLSAAVTVEPYSGTYDGGAHGLKVTAPSEVTVQFYSSEMNYWTSSLTYTDAGTYTVQWKAQVSEYYKKNYNTFETSGESTITISRVDLASVMTITPTSPTFTYNRYSYETDSPYTYHSIGIQVTDGGKEVTSVPGMKYTKYFTVQYSTDNGATWSNQNPSFTDVGTYPVKWRIVVSGDTVASAASTEKGNFIQASGEATVTIEKADLPFDKLYGYSGPYDGYYHYLFGYHVYTSGDWGYSYWPGYLLDELTYQFSWTDDDGNTKSTTVTGQNTFINLYEGNVPMFKEQNVSSLSGSETGKSVTVTISGANYNTKTFTYTVKIGPGYSAAEDYEGNYDGSAHTIINYVPRGSVMEYKVTGTDTWLPASQEPSRTDVGTTSVDWKASFDSDGDGKVGGYDANGGADADGIYNSFGSLEVRTGTNTITVNPVGITVKANDKTITYGDAPSHNGVTYDFSGGGSEADLEGTLTYTYDYNQYNNVTNFNGTGNTYKITPSGLTSKNFDVTFEEGTLTVVQKQLGIDWGEMARTRTLDGRPVPVATGTVNNDQITLIVAWVKEDGKWIATVTGMTGEKAGNYKLPDASQLTHTYDIIHNVTHSTGDGYTYTGDATVKDTEDYSFEVTISTGYKKGSSFKVTVNGTEVKLDDQGKYTVENVTEDIHVEISGVVKVSNGGSDDTGSGKTPQTGDASNIEFWCVMIVISLAALAILLFLAKRILFSKEKDRR